MIDMSKNFGIAVFRLIRIFDRDFSGIGCNSPMPGSHHDLPPVELNCIYVNRIIDLGIECLVKG